MFVFTMKKDLLPNQVHLPNVQQAKYWNAKVYSQSLYTRQPSEEMGEQVSDLPPWRQKDWSAYGISRMV